MPLPSDHWSSYVASSVVMVPGALEDMMKGRDVNFEQRVTGTRSDGSLAVQATPK